jgi:integrase
MLLNAILEAAVHNRMVTHNVARGVEVPRLVPAKRRFLTHEQIRDLADAVEPRYRVLVLTIAYSGMRWGEASAIKRQSCDLLRRRLHVTESVVQLGTEHVWGTPKTHRTRSVQLPTFVCEELAEHLMRHVGPEPEALVFTNSVGGVLRHTDFHKRTWKPAVKRAGLPADLKIHELRHTAASLLIAEGAGPKSVQAQLGHSTITTTFDVYGHLFPNHLDAVMDGIDAKWRRPGDASDGLRSQA